MKLNQLILQTFLLFFCLSSCKTDMPGALHENANVSTKEQSRVSAAPSLGVLVDGAIYKITALASLPNGPVVEITGNQTTEGAQIQQWWWFPNNGQKWKLVKIDTEYYKLVSMTSNKCLQAPSTTPGVILTQGTDNGSDFQRWKIEYTGNYLFTLTNKATGMKAILDPNNGSPGQKIRQTNTVIGSEDRFEFHNLNFQNPLYSGADPFVAEKDGYYYYLCTRGSYIGIKKTRDMSLINAIPEVTVWRAAAGTDYASDLWAPEMFFLDGKWYIYFAANNGVGGTQNMLVLENTNLDPTVGPWIYKGKITDAADLWAIDGTILTKGSSRYFVWSGREVATSTKQCLYIAPMSNPWTITGSRIKISSPTNTWEKYEPGAVIGVGVNEAPIMLQKSPTSSTRIIYSASRYSSDEYCLAQILLGGGGNPLNPADWIDKKQLLVKSPTNSVYGPGHNGFFTSSYTDGNGVLRSENWLIYHARSIPGSPSGARTVRMQRVT